MGRLIGPNLLKKKSLNLKSLTPEKDLKVYGGGIIKSAHAKIVKEQYEGIYAEALENLAGTCEQLKEAYSFMDKKMKKDYVAFLEKNKCLVMQLYLQVKQTENNVNPRARSKDAIIKKLKFNQ